MSTISAQALNLRGIIPGGKGGIIPGGGGGGGGGIAIGAPLSLLSFWLLLFWTTGDAIPGGGSMPCWNITNGFIYVRDLQKQSKIIDTRDVN